MAGLTRPSLVPMRVRAMMEILVTSLPVPQVVGMAMTSFSCTDGNRLKYRLWTVSGRLQPSSLHRSMMAPPPTAMTRS